MDAVKRELRFQMSVMEGKIGAMEGRMQRRMGQVENRTANKMSVMELRMESKMDRILELLHGQRPDRDDPAHAPSWPGAAGDTDRMADIGPARPCRSEPA